MKVLTLIFWDIFYGIMIFLVSLMPLLDLVYRKRLVILLVWGTIIVSGFRYNIGADFQTYQLLYEIFADGDMGIGMIIEPFFVWVSYILGYLGLKVQVIFLFYAIVSIYGIYYGFKKYFVDLWIGTGIAFLLFLSYNSNGGFWWSMNCIRQAAALGIVFAGSSFLYSNRIKYFLLLIAVACFFHYSAVIAVFMVVLARCNFKRKNVLVVVFLSFFVSYIGLSQRIVISVMETIAGWAGKYEAAFEMLDSASGTFATASYLYVFMYLLAFFICNRCSEKFQVVFNLSTVYIVIRILTSFSLEGSVIHHLLHRFEVYYLPFFLIYVSEGILCFVRRCRPVRAGWLVMIFAISLFTLLSLENIAATGGEDTFLIKGKGTENVIYDYNLDLF